MVIIQYIFTCWIKPLWIIYLHILNALFNLCNYRIIGSVYICKQFIQIFINVNLHHARITIISKHPAMLPHCICLRFFTRSRIVNSLQSRKCYATAQCVSANNEIAASFIIRTFHIILSIHNKNSELISS